MFFLCIRFLILLKLARRVVALLQAKGNLSITTVESCTGGGLAFFLTTVPGIGKFLAESLVLYGNRAKEMYFRLYAEKTYLEAVEEGYVYSHVVAQKYVKTALSTGVNEKVVVFTSGVMSKFFDGNFNKEVRAGDLYVGVGIRQNGTSLITSEKYQIQVHEARWRNQLVAIELAFRYLIKQLENL